MVIAIVGNDNGRGLQHDAGIVEDLARRAGHDVVRLQFRTPVAVRADLAIFLEVAPPWAAEVAPVRWGIFNPEWWGAPGHGQWLPIGAFHRVLAKTQEGLRLFSVLTPRAQYVGFTARDRYTPGTRQRGFLHAPGKSTAKGTAAILDAWRRYDLPPLMVIGDVGGGADPPGVTRVPWVDDDSLRTWQNAYAFALAPSSTEGFGHSLWESLSCGAVVARSDWPPMNETPGVDIVAHPWRRQRLATTCMVTPEAIRDAVEACWDLDDGGVAELSRRSREAYLGGRAAFEGRMLELLGGELARAATG